MDAMFCRKLKEFIVDEDKGQREYGNFAHNLIGRVDPRIVDTIKQIAYDEGGHRDYFKLLY